MDPSQVHVPSNTSTLPERLLDELLTELRSDREHLRTEHRELVKERRSERRRPPVRLNAAPNSCMRLCIFCEGRPYLIYLRVVNVA